MNRNELNVRAMRPLLGKSSKRTNRLHAVAVEAVPIEIARPEAQATRAGGKVRIRRRRPEVAVRASAAETGIVAVADCGEKDTL